MKIITFKKLSYLIILVVLVSYSNSYSSDQIWENEVLIGVSYRTGTIEKSLYTLNAKSEYFSLDYDWLHSLYSEYGQTKGEQTEGLVRTKSEYRLRFKNPKFFGSIFIQGLHDVIRDINLRAQLGPNIGLYLIESDKSKLDLSIGLNAAYEILEINEFSYAAFRFSTKFDHKLNDHASLYASFEINGDIEEITEDYYGLFVLGLKNKISKEIFMHTELRNDYDNQPSNNTTEKNDTLVTLGLGYNF